MIESKGSRSEKNLNEKERLQGSDEPHNLLKSVAKELIHCGTEQVVCNYEGRGQYHGELQNTQCSRLR